MALPDKKPPTEKVLEYICVGCWSSFTVEAASREDDDDGVIVCPSCGHSQPTVDEVLANQEVPAAASPATDVVELDADVVEVVDDDVIDDAPAPPPVDPPSEPSLDIPMDVSADIPMDIPMDFGDEPPPATDEPPLDIPVSDEPEGSGDTDPTIGAGEMLQGWETANPDTVTWKMRTSGGITFNFHGIGALMGWAASKKNLGRATLTVDGRDEWSDFTEFGTLYRKLADPLAALKLVGHQISLPPDEHEAGISEALLSMADSADAASGLPILTDAPDGGADRSGDEAEGSRAPRTGQSRPGASAKATTDFTFITKVNAGKGGGRAVPFVLGLLLGAATVLVLWYVGVLDMLPLRPM